MAQYFHSVDGISLTAATAKTIFELGTSASVRARIKSVWVMFHGTTATDAPVKIEIGRFSAGVTTATTLAASKQDTADGASGCTTKHTTTTEGAGTVSDAFVFRVPPTSGVIYQFPLGDELIIAVSSFLRIRCTAGANTTVTYGITWVE